MSNHSECNKNYTIIITRCVLKERSECIALRRLRCCGTTFSHRPWKISAARLGNGRE